MVRRRLEKPPGDVDSVDQIGDQSASRDPFTQSKPLQPMGEQQTLLPSRDENILLLQYREGKKEKVLPSGGKQKTVHEPRSLLQAGVSYC